MSSVNLTMSEIQAKIGKWARATFPDQTDGTLWRHINEEIDELGEALGIDYARGRLISVELADVAILLLCLADHVTVDLAEAIAAKHAINITRTWAEDRHGIHHHADHKEP